MKINVPQTDEEIGKQVDFIYANYSKEIEALTRVGVVNIMALSKRTTELAPGELMEAFQKAVFEIVGASFQYGYNAGKTKKKPSKE